MIQTLRPQSYRSLLSPALSTRQIITRTTSPFHRLFVSGRGIREGRLAAEDADYEGAINLLNKYQSPPRQPLQRKPETPKERTKNWLRHLGFDVDCLQVPKVIHVAGTKGKGTTCYYCNRILVEHQRITGEPKRIGCLTSPHKMDVRERILINNEKISKPLFSYYVRMLDTKIYSLSSQLDLEIPRVPGYPGFLSLLAIYIFILEKVDVAIIETGMGGETDSTNVFSHPVATGITTIGLDHVYVLGHTVEEIAWHKGGIFKSGSLAGTVPQDEAVLKVLRKRAEERHVTGGLQVITDRKVHEYGVKVDPDMSYQRSNAALAIFLAEAYLKSADPRFSMTGDLARSLQDVELLGRSQIIDDGDNTWFISSGVNEISLKAAVSWFKTVQRLGHMGAPQVLLFNQNFSKASPRDPYPMLKVIHEALCPAMLQGVIFCTDQLDEIGKEKPDLIDFRTNREAVSSLYNQRENSRIWKELGGSGDIAVVHTTRDAVRLIKDNYKGAEVLVTGSGYLAGNILQILQS